MFGSTSKDVAAPSGQWLKRGEQELWLAWNRHAKAKRIKILVSAKGPRLTLPMRASEKSALQFVAEHEDWIWLQWQKYQPEDLAPLQIGEADFLSILGQDLPVVWREDRALQIFRHPDHWLIHTSARSSVKQLQAALLQNYKQLGQAWFVQRMQRYLPNLPHAPSAMQIRPLRSLWGSLNAANVVSLDVALLFAPEPVGEYVLVHELCHILQRNHSPKFWQEVEQRWPQWREQRDYLKVHGQSLKIEAKRIFG
jgi:predicted metal-dependent hydrolase